MLLFVMKRNFPRLILLYVLQRIQSWPGISTLDLFRPHCQSSDLCMCQETPTEQERSVMSVFLIEIFLFDFFKACQKKHSLYFDLLLPF